MANADKREDVYTKAEFARQLKISVDQLQRHIDGDLPPLVTPRYSGTKPLFTERDRLDFLESLPKAPTARMGRA